MEIFESDKEEFFKGTLRRGTYRFYMGAFMKRVFNHLKKYKLSSLLLPMIAEYARFPRETGSDRSDRKFPRLLDSAVSISEAGSS